MERVEKEQKQDKSSVGPSPMKMARMLGNQAYIQLNGLQEGQKSANNNTGIPTQMKEDFELKSRLSFDDVKVHYNSDKPAQLQALAYTQGSQVYVGPGQEKYLAHELGHVVQQKQGRVRPSFQLRGVNINDDESLEREADAMSAVAQCKIFDRVGVIAQRAFAYGGIVQRKYVLDSNALKEKLGCSRVRGEWRAHHIIPNFCMAKLGVRDKTHFFATECNEAWNGIMLPFAEDNYGSEEATVQGSDHAYVIHNSGHDDYNVHVKDRITGGNVEEKRTSAQAVARSIKEHLIRNYAGAAGKANKPHPNINDFGGV